MVVGHEFVGEVAEVGSNVADFRPGDVVSAIKARIRLCGSAPEKRMFASRKILIS